jgi:hypothetical protein
MHVVLVVGKVGRGRGHGWGGEGRGWARGELSVYRAFFMFFATVLYWPQGPKCLPLWRWLLVVLLLGGLSGKCWVHAAHGDNLLCVGCGVVMEKVYEEVVRFAEEKGKSIDMTQKDTYQVDFTERVKSVCTKEFSEQHSKYTQSACVEMSTTFANVVSNAFEGDEPTERMAFDKIHKVCVTALDYCDDYVGEFPPSPTTCDMCRAVVADVVAVVNRKKNWDLFRSKKHIYSVFDTVCSTMVYRFPNRTTNQMSDACADVIENYEHEIAKILMEDIDHAIDRVCSKEVVGACSRNWKKGDFVWRSPFHRTPRNEQPFFAGSDL